MSEDQQKWLRLEAGDGWQIFIPDFGNESHSTDTKNTKMKWLWMNCPCKPKVNILDKIIVHNSFTDRDGFNLKDKE